MKNVPPSVRAALKNRGADAILNQEGDYYDFKSQIDQIIHQGENQQPQELGDSSGVMDNFEEELSPQEQKATERIEQLGDKYKPAESENKSDDDPFDEEDMDGDLNILEDDPEFVRIRNTESKGRWKELEDKGKEMRNHLLKKVGGYWQDDKSNEQIKEEYKQTLKEDFDLNDQEAKAVIKKYMDFASGSLQSLAEIRDLYDEDDDVKSKPERPGMPEHHWEEPDDPEKERHIVIDEGPHKGERYDNPDDYKNSVNNDDEELENLRKANPESQFERIDGQIYSKTPTVGGRKDGKDVIEGYTYTPVDSTDKKEYFIGKNNKRYRNFQDYANEIGYGAEQGQYQDFGDLRYYPVSDEDRKKAGPKYLGRYHSIRDAFGLNDWYRGETEEEPINGASVVRLPDGYYSINPNITQMSFKTREALKDYLDNENKDYSTIERYQDDYPVFRTGRDANGKEYDYEPVDRYIEVQKQRQDFQSKSNAFNNAVGKFIDSNGSDQDLDESINAMKKLGYSDDEILRKVLTMFKGTIK